MEVGIGTRPPVSPATAWRRPPLSVPEGRRPSFSQSVRIGLGAGAFIFALNGTGTLFPMVSAAPSDALPFIIPTVAATVAAALFWVAYAIMLTASALKGRRPSGPAALGLDGNPAATVWFALGVLAPLLIGYPFSWLYRPSAASSLVAAMEYFGPFLIAVVCFSIAFALRNRDIKRAVLAGLAPTFLTSPDRRWWWDGSQWVGVSAVDPPQALHSPDGNYWWSGEAWLPLPRRPPKRPSRSRSLVGGH